jgi:hypothetical protein
VKMVKIKLHGQMFFLKRKCVLYPLVQVLFTYVSEPTLRTAKLLKDMSSATVSRPTDKLPLPLRPTDDDWSKMLAAHVHMGTKNLDNKMVFHVSKNYIFILESI